MDIASYSSDSRAVIKNAREVAASFRHPEIEIEHLLIATLRSEDSQVPSICNQIDKSPKMIESLTEVYLKDQASRSSARENLTISPAVQDVLNQAIEEKNKLYDTLVEPEHIFIAIFDPKSAMAPYLREKLDITKESLYRAIAEGKAVEEIATGKPSVSTDEGDVDSAGSGKVAGTLRYCIDLTNQAAAGEFDPVIGREKEIQQAIQILLRRRKNSPILVGGPGTGKTAIVEGLAQAVVDGQVPNALKTVKVMELDMGAMIAGAKYKGEFEERLKKLIGEVVRTGGKIILFIDEVHTIVGAGGAGAGDAANLLKPALARGQIKIIGATTEEEYTKHIERDKALERRFERIKVNEPSIEDSIRIVSGVIEKYQTHHKISYDQEAIVASVKLAKRYLSERNLPDIALDVIDEAGSEFGVKGEFARNKIPEIEKMIPEIEKLITTGDGKTPEAHADVFADIETGYDDFARQLDILEGYWGHRADPGSDDAPAKLITHADYTADFKAKSDRFAQLMQVVTDLKPDIDDSDIGAVIARRTGIPLQKMMTSEKERLINMEAHLSTQIIGQHNAIKVIANAIRKARAGLKMPNRPVGSFLFLGPTGTGKTYLPKLLAEFLFDDKNAMVRFDMSEYMETHSVAKMIGAPPGYVGYEAGGMLTESVRKKPFSVVLFDEVEKAHPDVFNILLQLLDDGRLTDGQGRTVDFSNCIVVLTSNYAADKILDADREGREVKMDEVRQFLFTKFRPEFLNRLNDIIIFHSFTPEEVEKIVALEFKQLCVLLRDQNITATLSDAGINKLAKDGYTIELGARPLQRTIERDIINKLSVEIITGNIAPGDSVVIDVVDDAYTFEKKNNSNP